MPEKRVIEYIGVWKNKDGVEDPVTMRQRIYARNALSGNTEYRQSLDSRDPLWSFGGILWTPVDSGDYIIKFQSVLRVTRCNLTPAVSTIFQTTLHARCALHKGGPCNGTLAGGTSLEFSSSVHYHFHNDPANVQDAWGGCESTLATTMVVATYFYYMTGLRMGVGDISQPGGGSFPPHSCHQNGLEIDLRYIRNDLAEQPLNVQTSPSQFNKPLTIQLLQLWAATGVVDEIIVSPDTGITSADVPGANLVQDTTNVHDNHFHVTLRDADGPDSKNC